MGKRAAFVAAPFLALALSWWNVASASTTDDAKSDAAWIHQAQLADGAIATSVDRTAIWPYQGSYAAWGLASVAAQTGDFAKADWAWNWLSWYQKHQDAGGFVQDYRVSGNKESTTGDEDSTDATSGLFLLASYATYQAKPKDYLSRLKKLAPAVTKAVGAIEATMDGDGLTWAKPTYHVKYLMDNVETYAGLQAAARIAAALGDGALGTRAQADAAREQAGIRSLWEPSSGTFDWALHENGYREINDWAAFYPDSAEQVWVVAFGATDPDTETALLSQFDSAQPTWDQPTSTVTFTDGSTQQAGYWPVIGWAFLRMGQTARAAAAAQSIRSAAIASNRAWPFTTGNAGQLINLELGVSPP